MSDCSIIYDIIKNPDTENLRVEYKQFGILDTRSGCAKFIQEIVSFANKYGGQLLLGITDKKVFEGAKIDNPDDLKGQINNLIHDWISPIIECEINYFRCKEGDVMLINIPQKKDIPYAYVKKSYDKIISREYLIRTPHGMRHISDRQLQFLFLQQEIDFNYPIHTIIHFKKKNLRVTKQLEQPLVVKSIYANIMNNLPLDKRNKLVNDTKHISSFLIEVSPYALLTSLSQYFNVSWFMEISDNAITKSTYTRPEYRVKLEDIPEIPAYITQPEFRVLSLPPNTTIQIDHQKKSSTLVLVNPDFTLSFLFSKFRYDWEEGIEDSHPEIKEIGGFTEIKEIFSEYAHVPLLIHYQAEFNFPETNFERFKDYSDFSQNIKKILERDWDYEKFKAKLPHSLHYKINHKLSQLLKKD